MDRRAEAQDHLSCVRDVAQEGPHTLPALKTGLGEVPEVEHNPHVSVRVLEIGSHATLLAFCHPDSLMVCLEVPCRPVQHLDWDWVACGSNGKGSWSAARR